MIKRDKLRRNIVITSTLLSSMLLTTGCDTVQEIIDDYEPEYQNEMEVYGPANPTEETLETEESLETEELPYYDYGEIDYGEAMLEYGVRENYYYDKDLQESASTEESKDIDDEVVCVYGPVEDFYK